jgi:hypothetical protein
VYEIWLVLNIVWEIARENVVAVIFGALVLVALALNASRKPAVAWRRALWPAAGAGVVVAVVAVLAVPSLTRASLSDMKYWVDWLNLFAIAAAAGGITAAFAWPLMTMVRGVPR